MGGGAVIGGLLNSRKALSQGIKNLFQKNGEKLGDKVGGYHYSSRNKSISRLVNQDNNYVREVHNQEYIQIYKLHQEQALT